MGKLKPIGSEKLEGMAKINRMIELAKYKENKPSRLNEDSSEEYSIRLADGNKYHIVKEKTGYVIKKGLNESTLEYIEPMKGRKYYSSYSQALKRLNLITKEVNVNEGNRKNISLFSEGEEGEKKYFLKRSTNELAPTPQEQIPVPAPAPAAAAPTPAPIPSPDASVPPPSDEVPSPEPTDDMPEMPEMDDADMTPETSPESAPETVTFKTIQKLTGKLGQKLRTLNADEENKMSSKDVKYVINSILSALDLNSLEDEDREEIMTKFEGEDMGGEDMGEPEMEMPDMEDMGDEEMPDAEMTPEPPQPPAEEEVAEYDSIDEDEDFEFGLEDDFEKNYKPSFRGMGRDESDKMESMIEGIFSESKVDKVLRNYFKLDDKEKRMLQNNKQLNENINKYSKSISQKVASKKFVNENKNVNFVGVSEKGSLVFQKGNKQYKITNKGQIL